MGWSLLLDVKGTREEKKVVPPDPLGSTGLGCMTMSSDSLRKDGYRIINHNSERGREGGDHQTGSPGGRQRVTGGCESSLGIQGLSGFSVGG